MCNKTVGTSLFAIQSVLEHYKAQKMIEIFVYTFPSLFKSVSDKYKSQEIWDEVVSEDLFMLKYSQINIKPQIFITKLLMLVCKH